MSTSQALCVQEASADWPVNGDYTKSTTQMSNGYYYYTKTTTSADTTEVLLYVSQWGEGYRDGDDFSLDNNWYFTRGLALGTNPWIDPSGGLGISTETSLGYCQQPDGLINIQSPIECKRWWNLGLIIITEGACPVTTKDPTPEPTKAPTHAPIYPGVHIIALTQDNQDILVDEHNRCRGEIARGLTVDKDGILLPKAANMYPMVWDQTISANAQIWANKCDYMHDPSNSRYAENLARSSNREFEKTVLDTATASWFSEHNDYKWGMPFNAENANKIGHFLNVIYEPMTRIGCAIVTCPDMVIPPATRTYVMDYIVCRYTASPSRVRYDEPYVISDTTGSGCHDRQVDARGLCVASD